MGDNSLWSCIFVSMPLRTCRIYPWVLANPRVVRREVGIDRLKRYLSSNQRPIAFHVLLTRLSNHPFAALGDGTFAPDCMTALDYVKRLLRGIRGAK